LEAVFCTTHRGHLDVVDVVDVVDVGGVGGEGGALSSYPPHRRFSAQPQAEKGGRRAAGSLGQALGFLTVIGGGAAPRPAAVAWFPLVGAALGLTVGGIWLGAGYLWPAAVAAVLVVVADLALTGMLHFDGFVDSADGLLAPMDRSQRLAAMADPGLGAFGVGAAFAGLGLRWAALATMAAAPLLIAGLWCLSRVTMAAALCWGRPARPRGLSAAFVGDRQSVSASGRPRGLSIVAVLAGLAGGAGLCFVAIGWPGLVAVASALVAATAVVVVARRRLGGFTGDVLGATGFAAETVGLLVAAARW